MQHVVALRAKVFIAFADSGVFVDRAEVRRAERRHLPFDLADAPVGSCYGFDLHGLLLRARGRQLIRFPELVDQLLLFQFARRFLLFESCRLALEKQNILILFLRLFFGLVALSLHCRARFNLCPQHLLLRVCILLKRFYLRVLRGNVLLGCFDLHAERVDQRLLLRPVSLHRLAQRLHLGDGLFGGGFFRVLFRNRHAKRRKALLHLRKRIRLLVRLRLQRLLLRGDFCQLRLHALQLPGKKAQPSLVAAASLQKPFQLPPAGIFRL